MYLEVFCLETGEKEKLTLEPKLKWQQAQIMKNAQDFYIYTHTYLRTHSLPNQDKESVYLQYWRKGKLLLNALPPKPTSAEITRWKNSLTINE